MLSFIFCRDKLLFDSKECRCTIGQVAAAFRPTGYLCSFTVTVGTYLLNQKFRHSEKLVAPYNCCVCELPTLYLVNFHYLMFFSIPTTFYNFLSTCFYFAIQRLIFEGNLENRCVKRLFSPDSEERLDKKEIVSTKFMLCVFFTCFCKLLYRLLIFMGTFVFVLQVCFATFDPPEPTLFGGVGHFCVVVINVLKNRIDLIDSMRGPNDPDAKRVVHLMGRNIKKLWREARDSKGNSFEPKSIDHWPLGYVNSPRQGNT